MRMQGIGFALALAVSLHGAALRVLRQVRLSDYTGEPQGGFLYKLQYKEVRAVSFSPDERWIAVALEQQSRWLSQQNDLLILAREPQQNDLKYSGRIGPLLTPLNGFPQLIWSPGGDYLAIGTFAPTLLRLSDGTSCQISREVPGRTELGGFVSGNEMVVAESEEPERPLGPTESSTLVLYDLDCQQQYYRQVPGRILSLDAEPSSGLIAIALAGGAGILFDAKSGKEIWRWNGPERGSVKLLAGGAAACQAAQAGPNHEPPQCWDIGQRSEIERTPEAWGGAPFAVASRGPLAAFSDGTYSYDTFWMAEVRGVKRDLLWDVLAGRKVLSWRPGPQPCEFGMKIWRDCGKRFVFGLSPNGRYLADGGGGKLRIYEIKR